MCMAGWRNKLRHVEVSPQQVDIDIYTGFLLLPSKRTHFPDLLQLHPGWLLAQRLGLESCFVGSVSVAGNDDVEGLIILDEQTL